MSLVTCAACSRYIRRTESACPFCEAVVTRAAADAPERAAPTTRLGRAALLAFAAASVGAAACGVSNDSSQRSPLEGDASNSGGAANAGGTTGTGGATAQGGSVNASGATGMGGNLNGAGGDMPVAVYGAPFPVDQVDAGRDGGDSGAGGKDISQPVYGAPPPQ